jgi:hypothetical protein
MISANPCRQEGRGRGRGLERGGETNVGVANDRVIEKGWNDRETIERGEDNKETDRKDNVACN